MTRRRERKYKTDLAQIFNLAQRALQTSSLLTVRGFLCRIAAIADRGDHDDMQPGLRARAA